VYEQGYFNIKVTPLGGETIFLDAENPKDTLEFIEGAKNSWCSFLYEVVKWSPSMVNKERLAWIKFFGIPLHAWEDSFFRFLYFGRGTIVDIDEPTRCKRRLDVARIKIRTPLTDWCNRNVRVKINEDIFDIKLVEEMPGDQEFNDVKELRNVVMETQSLKFLIGIIRA
jgi:hypothetical protein